MIFHPLLQPKKTNLETKISNFANDMATREPEELNKPISVYNKGWVMVMTIYALLAVLAFMLVPVITLTFGESTTNFLENVKDLVNFGAPTLLIVAILVGITGYYGYTKIAWWLSFGFWISIMVLIINITTAVNWLNFGIFWIIIGTLVGLLIGSVFELICACHRHRENFIKFLLIIGIIATAIASYVSIQNSANRRVKAITLEQAQGELDFILYKPDKIPERFTIYQSFVYVSKDKFYMYLGDDPYPPPPVIEFLKGLEVVETKGIGQLPEEYVSNYSKVMINGAEGRYREDRGRTIVEWQQDNTYIILASYSPINGKELIDFARSFVPLVSKF
ncbi:MAG: hypothetical protein WCT08_02285 [Patescibacteria group bacterium]|jgi:hypothetical protein